MNRRSKTLACARFVVSAAVLAALSLGPALPTLAADPVAKLLAGNVAYAPAATGRGQSLDLYGPVTSPDRKRPVALFVHGGGWRHGDKAMVGEKPGAFVSRGYLFATANYRLEHAVSPREQAGDVALAVKWLHAHVAEHGGDPTQIFLVGHSAGAHLVALVGTDERLLAANGLDLTAVRGVVLLDGAGYDVPRQIASASLPGLKQLYRDAFGDDADAQRDASPVEHVRAGRKHPPFLLVHVGRRQDSREQSELLATKLREAGGRATTVHEPEKNHLSLNRELGLPGDGPTARIFDFFEAGMAAP